MYFVNLLPAIAYTLDMYRRTGEFFGVNEALFSSALAAVVFSTLSAQPLTIVGVTGLISLFNFTIYDIIKIYDVSIYPQFMAWTGIWAAIFHWLVAVFNGCDYMRYVTDFSSESFGLYVGIIYIIKGVEELVNEFTTEGSAAGYLACLIAILYFGTVYALEKLGSSTLWRAGFRGILADYAYVFATVFWVGFSHIPGPLKDAHIMRVPIETAFHPTQPRNWLIDFWNLDVKWVFVAMPFGFLTMLLFYYDHNVSSITAQARQYPLQKPGGFHWDYFLLGCTTFVAGILGLPMPNGLVPQAPVHTDSLTVYKTSLKIIPTSEGEDTEIRRPIVSATHVVEQRLSHLFMGLALIGTMTGPLLVVLHTMPAAVFAGVFFVVGKFVFLHSERRFIQRDELLLQVRRRKIWLYIILQFADVAACVAISHTLAAIGFPVLIILLIPMRVVLVPRWFTQQELQILDDFTATNKMVLASLGGKPGLPEDMSYTPTTHSASYEAISATNPSISAAGKVVLITGAGSGIGNAASFSFATAGAKALVLLGRRVELLEQVAKSIHETGLDTGTACFAVDVCDEQVVKSTLSQIVSKYERIDIVIHAAGALPPLGPLATVPLDDLWRAFEVNIKGFLTLAQAMLAVTTSDQDRSSQPVLIVLNTAGSIMSPLPGMGGYVASKMSSLKLAEYVASENKDKLRVISVHPGLIRTPMAEELEKTGLKFPYDDISLPADFLVWAASKEAAFLNGKFAFANWDVEELKASAGKIEGGADLSLMLRGL
ncbi:putative transporter [Colletotrichum sp. SAR 10_70]|nr:putative transporter [Colletotrichum sp. SAR 10_71]KAI8197965.1 putative transporter [Colletotrichum sp. SAR 10_65]KAI8199604.1 putative transporter [Colletotrichum sp. SAR 10_70]KAI8213484.1 putative transporter [Colletotrichum sp. SAR 10_76]